MHWLRRVSGCSIANEQSGTCSRHSDGRRRNNFSHLVLCTSPFKERQFLCRGNGFRQHRKRGQGIESIFFPDTWEGFPDNGHWKMQLWMRVIHGALVSAICQPASQPVTHCFGGRLPVPGGYVCVGVQIRKEVTPDTWPTALLLFYLIATVCLSQFLIIQK